MIFATTDAFNAIGNIIMGSIGFFNPLLRVLKSFYSIEKNSSSRIRYNCINHLGYEHLQSAANKEIKSNINGAVFRKIKKKLLFFDEEVIDTSYNITNKNRILSNTGKKQILNLIQNITNKTSTSGDLVSSDNNSNT
ncbi:uncharacterized protein ELE39_001672 [Cryptosporidium sp. chipmunk genotype I]|uniref:uncharacterized protein n=1 Tax=Cryptosporidium sp. chipmunk genotype I TaxID=1280935 RepID=UPI00351A9DC0|nr:hypothetical protein ELE39_001672 [Cryptosporidium sp. chipmunk genotype I]